METNIGKMYEKLLSTLKENRPNTDFSLIERAFKFAFDAHGDQKRKSGEPYIIHPLSVAQILAELGMDRETVAAGLLHDVIEDTSYSYGDIEKTYGAEVAKLVDGVTKLEGLSYSSTEDEQAENYRKMLLAMSNDIRVIIIKIADRLHNLRTLEHMSREKQIEKAQETIDIYCPLAHRLGIASVRYELEDLSFRYLSPEKYEDLKTQINKKIYERRAQVDFYCAQISERLAFDGIKNFEVSGRPKHFFSIYKKMESQSKTLDQIYDLIAVRVLVETVTDCYHVMGIVNNMYTAVPNRLKDYISMPKSNGYKSLHTTLVGNDGSPFEAQIRTFEMHRESEFGVTAHWRYKERKSGSEADSELEKMTWLREILDMQRYYSDSNEDFLTDLKSDLDVFKTHVYCFSPKGRVVNLITGSTPIDFAYAIHSKVGDKMVGAKVNEKIVPLDYKLESGDRVEIMTNPSSKGPSLDWLNIVKTSSARSKIRAWFRNNDRSANITIGRDLMEAFAKRRGYPLSQLIIPERVAPILTRYGYPDWEAVCAAVGHGGLKEGQVVGRLIDELEAENKKAMTAEQVTEQLLKSSAIDLAKAEEAKKRRRGKSAIFIEGAEDIEIEPRYSKCCSPVPGDDIVVFLTRGRGPSIHRADCVNILNFTGDEAMRIKKAKWSAGATGLDFFRADIIIICDDRIGMLLDVSNFFAAEGVNISGITARTNIRGGGAVFDVSFNIKDIGELERLLNKIRRIEGVREVKRAVT